MTQAVTPELLAVTQEDREAASRLQEWNGDDMPLAARMLGGLEDDHPQVQAFARHRLASASAPDGELAAYRSDVLWWLEIATGKGYDSITAALTAAPQPPVVGETNRRIGGGIVLYERGGYAVSKAGEPFPPTADAYTFHSLPDEVIAALATQPAGAEQINYESALFDVLEALKPHFDIAGGFARGTGGVEMRFILSAIGFGPECVEGWIIGNGDGTHWRTWKDGAPVWTADREQATRYARREDAEAVHAEDDGAWLVTPFTSLPQRHLRLEMERIADLTERWTDSLVSQVNAIARAALKEPRDDR